MSSNIILPNEENNGNKIIKPGDLLFPTIDINQIQQEPNINENDMGNAGFKDPRAVNDLKYIIKDILSGDPKAAKRPEYTSLGYEQMKMAIKWLEQQGLDEATLQLLLEKPYLLTFKDKPPTPEEFLTSKYIGAQAESVWWPVKKNFLQFFDPLKPYRTAVLNPSIGSGKQQPVSSPICIGEEEYIEFKLHGIKFQFSLDDDIWLKDHYIKANDLSENDEVNFSLSINYLNMMIYCIEKTHLFDDAFNISSYDDLISYFKNIDENIYDEWNIYVQKHHIIPKSEGGTDDDSNLVKLPYYFHLMAHYLRGKEMESYGNKKAAFSNYKAVCFALNEASLPKDVVELHNKLEIILESLEKKNTYEKETIWITDGKTSKKVFDFEEIPDGWARGRTFRDPSNKRWINKDGKNFYVDKSEIDQYLKNGFKLGMFQTEKMKKSNPLKSSQSTLNTKWMHKDGIRKAVKLEDVEKYLQDGWLMGSASSTCKGKHWTTKSKGLNHWYTNGVISIQAKECPEGFKPGRTLCK